MKKILNFLMNNCITSTIVSIITYIFYGIVIGISMFPSDVWIRILFASSAVNTALIVSPLVNLIKLSPAAARFLTLSAPILSLLIYPKFVKTTMHWAFGEITDIPSTDSVCIALTPLVFLLNTGTEIASKHRAFLSD